MKFFGNAKTQTRKHFFHNQSGQILAEILIAVVMAGIVIGGVASDNNSGHYYGN